MPSMPGMTTYTMGTDDSSGAMTWDDGQVGGWGGWGGGRAGGALKSGWTSHACSLVISCTGPHRRAPELVKGAEQEEYRRIHVASWS